MTRTYTAHQIARYFLAKTDEEVGETISNLKLQKLCYYAQGVGLVARDIPMFAEPIEAWLHGPVVPTIYQEYKNYGNSAIPPVTDLNIAEYDAADRMILDDVYDYYGQYSAWRLREMTHREAPWKDAYTEGANKTITQEALQTFFVGEVSSDYAQKYDQVSRG
ncbi:MAG: type II toxin-antitoxin system antitoxin SocA domain-containing protein [Rhodospirillaceae bacterium]